MIRTVYFLVEKDWRLFWADKRAAILSFFVPIILASAFGILFNKPTSKSDQIKLPIILVVEDDSTLTKAIVADLLESPRAEAILLTREEAIGRVGDRRPGVAVVFPQGFDTAIKFCSETKPSIEILHNPLCSTESQWAEGVITEVVMKRLAKAVFGNNRDTTTPFQTKCVPVTGTHYAEFNSYSHSFSGMTLQYLLFWGMESGLLFLRERNRGVWQRTRATPVPLLVIFTGKVVSTALIAILQTAITFAFGKLVFGVTISGSWFGFGLLIVAISLLASATGLAVASIGGTESRARSITILVILGVSMVGGLWIPAFLLPGWARDLSLALPTTWAMRGLDGSTWQGLSLLGILPYIAAVTAFALVFLTFAIARLKASENAKSQGKQV